MTHGSKCLRLEESRKLAVGVTDTRTLKTPMETETETETEAETTATAAVHGSGSADDDEHNVSRKSIKGESAHIRANVLQSNNYNNSQNK